MTCFWYLATPYTRFPGGPQAAYYAALEQTAILVKAGHVVFSPIVHCHPLVESGFLSDGAFEAWEKFDHAMIAASAGVIVCKLPTWNESRGIRAEIDICSKIGKPVVFMAPGIVPDLSQKRWPD